MMQCPDCGSIDVYRTGWRGSDEVFKCRDCGSNFDEEGANVPREPDVSAIAYDAETAGRGDLPDDDDDDDNRLFYLMRDYGLLS